jgi:hypothetical protein
MQTNDTFARILNDVGAAAWFGGSLMGAIGLNGGAAASNDPDERLRVANAGWAAWTPVNFVAIAGHVAGAAMLTVGNRGRIAGQHGVASAATIKFGLTVAALGVTAAARMAGKKMEQGSGAPTTGVTEPGAGTPPEVAKSQRAQRVLQWMVPALSGGIVVMNAVMGEQERPQNVMSGVVERLTGGLAA